MRARIAIAGIMLVLAGTAVAAPAVAQRGRAPGPSRRGGGGRETNPADARTLLRARVTTVDAATGRVEMAAEGVTLGASFPPAVVAAVQPRDVVFVAVSVIDTRVATVTGCIAAVGLGDGSGSRTRAG